MSRTVEIEPSHIPSELRRLASSTKGANQSRRLLSNAAMLDGMSRAAILCAASGTGTDRRDRWDRAVDGVVRWQRIDLQRVVEERFGIAYRYAPSASCSRHWGSRTSAPGRGNRRRTARSPTR